MQFIQIQNSIQQKQKTFVPYYQHLQRSQSYNTINLIFFASKNLMKRKYSLSVLKLRNNSIQKAMKHIIILLTCILSFGSIQAQLVNKEVFSLLNLDYPGLEKVKKNYYEDKFEEASLELLKYYRQRTGVVNPFLDLENITISPTQQKWADDALQHILCTQWLPAFL